MSKYKINEEWIDWFKKYESSDFYWEEYYSTIKFSSDPKGCVKWTGSMNCKRAQARKDKSQYDGLSITKIAFVKNLHRKILYNKPKREDMFLIEQEKL